MTTNPAATPAVSFTTHAAFVLSPGAAWSWHTWRNSTGNKHEAILDKARELGAVGWDFGQADHELSSRSRW